MNGNVKIIDLEGQETTWKELHKLFGPEVRVDPRPDPDRPGFEVVELRMSYGHSTLVAEVLAGDGTPLPSVHVARWWDDPQLGGLPSDLRTWHQVGVAGQTKEDGCIGFGMGGGDHYNWPAGQYAVSEIWCQDNSARIHGLGYPWGMDYHLDTKFQWTEVGTPPQPPLPDDEVDEALQYLNTARVALAEAIRILEGIA